MCVVCKTKIYGCNKCNPKECDQPGSICIAVMPKNCVTFNNSCFAGCFTPDWQPLEDVKITGVNLPKQENNHG